MKCPKNGCDGTIYRFRPSHFVAAWCRAFTGVTLELTESQWKQIGLMCGTCDYMDFYTQDPQSVLRRTEGYFERTEPSPAGETRLLLCRPLARGARWLACGSPDCMGEPVSLRVYSDQAWRIRVSMPDGDAAGQTPARVSLKTMRS